MDVRLSAEQQALRESVRRVAARLGPRNVRDIDDAERRAKLDAAVHASGWREIRSATDDDEPSGSAVDVAIVVEQLARGSVDVPFLGPTLAAELRRLAGVAAAGAAPQTVVLDSDLSALTRLEGNGPVPSTSVAIDAAGISSALILLSGPAGYDLARVDVTRVDMAVQPGPDLTRPLGAVGAVASALLPRRGTGLADDSLERWSAFGLALVCADLVGTMDGAIELACDYAKIRRQYDVPIGSFQAVQHLLADAYVAAEGSRSVALHAAWAVDALPANDALAAAALAKAYCARATRTVCESVIQVHGGIGNTWECMAHVHLRRALLSIELFGDVGTSLARVIKHHGMEFDHGLR